MKKITLAIGLLILSTPVFASYINLQKCGVENIGTDVFSHKEICEGDTKSECVEYIGGPCQQFSVENIFGDDLKNPIASVTEEEFCNDEKSCFEKYNEKKCQELGSNPSISKDRKKVHCYKVLRFPQVVVGHKLIEDFEKKTAYESLKTTKENELKLAEENKQALKDKLKSTDIEKITTVRDLKAVVKELIELIK